MILQSYYESFKKDKSTICPFNEYVGDNISRFERELKWVIKSHMSDITGISYDKIYLVKNEIKSPTEENLIALLDIIDDFIEEIKYNIGYMSKNKLIREWNNFLDFEDLGVFI